MPKKTKKQKSKQEETIKEIEKFLNMETGTESRPVDIPAFFVDNSKKEEKKKNKEAKIIQEQDETAGSEKDDLSVEDRERIKQSPYIVDLRNLRKEIENAHPANKYKLEQKLESLSLGIKGRLRKARDIRKGMENLKRELIKEREIKEEIKKGRNLLTAASNSSRELNKVETPTRVLLQSFWLNRRMANVWRFYLADAGECLEKIYYKYLHELFIANLIVFCGFIIYKIFSGVYRILFFIFLRGRQALSIIFKVGRSCFKFLTAPFLILAKKGIEIFKKAAVGAKQGLLNFFSTSVKIIGNIKQKTAGEARELRVNLYQKGRGLISRSQQNISRIEEDITAKSRQTFKYANDLASVLKEEVGAWPEKVINKKTRVKSCFSFRFFPPFSWQRQLFAFAAIIFIIAVSFKAFASAPVISDIKGRVLGASEEAVANLQLAVAESEKWNFLEAEQKFIQAGRSFSQARESLTPVGEFLMLAKIIPLQKFQLAGQSERLLMTGESAAKIGEYLSLSLASLQLGEEEPSLALTERIDEFLYYNKKISEELKFFSESVNGINPNFFNEETAKQIRTLKKAAPGFKEGVEGIIKIGEAAKIFLGDEMDTRYLLVFQNNAEMRATGGFIGSYALIDFKKGEIKKIESPKGGSYDLQGGLYKRISSPGPLHLINSLWEFQDANWWPDWPKSAEKIVWFFESGWGSSVDGVIAITPTFIERFIALIGSVDMTEKYGKIITSDNFYEVIQSRPEGEGNNNPKEIIGDLAEAIIKELSGKINKQTFLKIAELTAESLEERHILFNFKNRALQELAENYEWDGSVKEVEGDYLMAVNTNIAGGKSDKKIKQTIFHQAEILADGSIIDTVTIKREHQAYKGERFAGVRNVNYLRLYVPKGSTLLEASGFSQPDKIYFNKPTAGAEHDPDIYLAEKGAQIHTESGVRIYNESGKTVFANWTMVDPGKTIEVVFKYKLPFKVDFQASDGVLRSVLENGEKKGKYVLYIQKQSGSVNCFINSKMILSEKLNLIWHNLPGWATKENGWEAKDALNTDKYLGAIIKK